MLSADTRQPPQRKVLHSVYMLEFCTTSRRLTYWLNRRFYYARHPSTGEELLSADTKQPPQRKVLHFVYMLEFCTTSRRLTYWLNRRDTVQTLNNHPVGLRPPPLHRRGIAQCRYEATTPEKGFTFCIYVRVLHNVTPIDLLAQSAILLRLPPLNRRGIMVCMI